MAAPIAMADANRIQHVACCAKHGLHRHTAWTDVLVQVYSKGKMAKLSSKVMLL